MRAGSSDASAARHGSSASLYWSCKPKSTAASRAIPICPRQSGRLLVTSRSMAKSLPRASVPSWLSPAIISRSTSSAGVTFRGTSSRSQLNETIMGGKRLESGHELLHFPDRPLQSHENGARNDRVADIQLAHLRNAGDRNDIVIVQ